jgi:hypothetical protein
VSKHLRTQIFFLFFNLTKKFFKNINKKSFVKLDFYSAKGIKKTLRKLNTLQKTTYVPKLKKLKDKLLVNLENYNKLPEKDFIKNYYKNTTRLKITNYKFYLNLIIYDN